MTKPLNDVGRIIFLTKSHIGDLLLMTPAVRAVRQSYPSARISILVVRGCEEVFARNPDVDEVITFDFHVLRSGRTWTKLREEVRVVQMLRARRFDLAICFYPEDRTTIWGFLSGARHRVGPARQPFRFLLTTKVESSETRAGVREYFLDTIRAVHATPSSAQTRFTVGVEATGWAEDFLRSHALGRGKVLIGVHPGGSGNYKIWPPDRFVALIEEVGRDARIETLLFEGPGDAEIIRQIREQLIRPVVIANTSQSLEHLAALMKRCRLCLVLDSGARHLAASVNVPTLAVFRRAHAAAWRIYSEEEGHSIIESSKPCSLCPEGKCRDLIPEGETFGAYCLREITVEEVLSKVRQKLKTTA